MKMKISIMFCLFFLVLSIFSVSVYATPVVPDGFVGILWGANREQIIKTMSDRGFTEQGTTTWAGRAPSTLVFRGVFDGVPCQLVFGLRNNALDNGGASELGLFTSPGQLEGLYKRMVSRVSEKYGPPQFDKKDEYKDDNGKIFEREWRAKWELIDNESSDKYVIQISLEIPGAIYYSNAPNPNKPEPSVTLSYIAVSLGERLQKKEY